MSGKYEAKTPSRLSRLVKRIGKIPHLFAKVTIAYCVTAATGASWYALRIMSRTGNDPAALLGVILGFFGGELLLLCLKTVLKKGRQGRTNNKRFGGHRDLTRGKDYTMNEKIIKRIANLLSVKSIVTITLTAVFAYLAVTNKIAQDFMTVYAVVIAFYFGTQTQREQSTADGTQITEEGK